MEELKLPFPSLQLLAGHAIVRRLVLMKIDEAYWYGNRHDSLRECQLRVDKLPVPPPPREYLKNVLRGFFEQVKEWIWWNDKNPGADILVDAHGNLDERRIFRHHFEKRYKHEFCREDFRDFVRLLEYLFWHYPEGCSNDFVTICLDLQKTDSSLEEYRLVGQVLHVVFRFVNRLSVPPEFNTLLEWQKHPLKISMEQKDVLVIYRVYKCHYDQDMFKVHVGHLQPSQRLEFTKDVLYEKMQDGCIQTLFRFLNVLDSETRQNCLLGLKEDRFHDTVDDCLECCLTPGYECLFIPMMRLVGLNLDRDGYFDLFAVFVNRIDVIGFDSLLLQFWELVPASTKSEFRSVLDNHDDDYHDNIKVPMKKLSRENRALFQVVFDEVSASLSKEQASRLLSVILV